MANAIDQTGLVKHSVCIKGHRTSLSLEPAFWDALKDVARQKRTSLGKLVAEIDETRAGNLSSAIRLYILRHLQGKH